MTSIGETIGTITGVRIVGPGSELLPDEGPFDVFLARGVIEDIAPAGALRRTRSRPGRGRGHPHPRALGSPRPCDAVGAGFAACTARACDAAGARRIAHGRTRPSPTVDVSAPGFVTRSGRDAPTLERARRGHGRHSDLPHQRRRAQRLAELRRLPARGLRRPTPSGLLREEPAFEISRRLNLVDPR